MHVSVCVCVCVNIYIYIYIRSYTQVAEPSRTANGTPPAAFSQRAAYGPL